MAKKASIYSAIVLIVAAGLFAGGYLLMNRRSQTECGFCRRHISPRAHVVAEVGGRRRDVCCAHCAVTEARQVSAVDGEAALLMARERLPNLILLDMMLPKLDGLGVLRALKRDPETKSIPVIVLTGLGKTNEWKHHIQ